MIKMKPRDLPLADDTLPDLALAYSLCVVTYCCVTY